MGRCDGVGGTTADGSTGAIPRKFSYENPFGDVFEDAFSDNVNVASLDSSGGDNGMRDSCLEVPWRYLQVFILGLRPAQSRRA